jgi:hypothetical protein
MRHVNSNLDALIGMSHLNIQMFGSGIFAHHSLIAIWLQSTNFKRRNESGACRDTFLKESKRRR